jgi:hypothetical protein
MIYRTTGHVFDKIFSIVHKNVQVVSSEGSVIIGRSDPDQKEIFTDPEHW